MSEAIDYLRDMKAIDKERRAGNRASGPEVLAAAGFGFDVKNGGAHLQVNTEKGRVDYWPGTEKWMVRGGRPQIGLDRFLAEFQPVGNAGPSEPLPAPVELSPIDDGRIQWKPHMSDFTVRVYQAAGWTVVFPEGRGERPATAVAEQEDELDI